MKNNTVKEFVRAAKTAIADMKTPSDGEAMKIVLRSAVTTGTVDVATASGLLGAVESKERALRNAAKLAA